MSALFVLAVCLIFLFARWYLQDSREHLLREMGQDMKSQAASKVALLTVWSGTLAGQVNVFVSQDMLRLFAGRGRQCRGFRSGHTAAVAAQRGRLRSRRHAVASGRQRFGERRPPEKAGASLAADEQLPARLCGKKQFYRPVPGQRRSADLSGSRRAAAGRRRAKALFAGGAGQQAAGAHACAPGKRQACHGHGLSCFCAPVCGFHGPTRGLAAAGHLQRAASIDRNHWRVRQRQPLRHVYPAGFDNKLQRISPTEADGVVALPGWALRDGKLPLGAYTDPGLPESEQAGLRPCPARAKPALACGARPCP